MAERSILAELAGIPLAAAPVPMRPYNVRQEPFVASGRASVGAATDQFSELDPMFGRWGITAPEASRLWRLALGAAGFGGVTRSRGFLRMEDDFGAPLRVLHNPTPQQMQEFLRSTRYKAARRLTDPATDDVYLWDAGAASLHQNMARRLGIEYSPRGVGEIVTLD
jgi:hypothetical protein